MAVPDEDNHAESQHPAAVAHSSSCFGDAKNRSARDKLVLMLDVRQLDYKTCAAS